MADLDAVIIQKLMNAQMYPEVRLHARNQILADLLVQFATDDRRTYFNMDRDGYTRLDGTLILTPEQMAALEDAVLEHKAKED
jgi:phosphatidate phosphatase PAH1